MSGYCATGRVRMVINPAITIIMAMTVANIGRRIKNLENMTLCDWDIKIPEEYYFFFELTTGFTFSPARTLRRALVT